MKSYPRFLFLEKDVKRQVLSSHPKLSCFVSKSFLPTETLIVVSKKKNKVTEDGVFFVKPSGLDEVQNHIFSFFRDCQAGLGLKNSTELLIKNLGG